MAFESKGKYLVKNTAIFAFGNISTKLIHFFLVPLYTYCLSMEEYGTVDMIISAALIVVPLMMCNIGEAIRRYLLDKDADKVKIQTIGLFWIIFGAVVSVIVYFVFHFIPGFEEFAFLMSAYAFTNALLTTTQEYLRGKEKLKLYALCSIVSTVGIAGFNILFLAYLKLGISGYIWSYIIAYGVTSVIAFIAGGQIQNLKRLVFDKKLFKEMSLFSIMLVPNSVMWWITNASDRLMVTYLVSAAANGIYTVSYKLPSIMSTFNAILMQAWQYSAIKVSSAEDKEKYNNQMFQFYFVSSAMIAAVLLLILKPFMWIYVAPGYINAWKYSPFLIFGLMFQILGTFVGTSYYVEKDMKGNLISSGIGAATNIVLNIMLIPIFEASGAAIATCISYIVVLIYRLVDTRKYLVIRAITPMTIKLTLVVFSMLIFVYLPGIFSYVLMSVSCIIILIITKDIYWNSVKKIVCKLSKR